MHHKRTSSRHCCRKFGNFVAGPTSGQLLTDLGATVIKIGTSNGRTLEALLSNSPLGESRTFIALNRGKKVFV